MTGIRGSGMTGSYSIPASGANTGAGAPGNTTTGVLSGSYTGGLSTHTLMVSSNRHF